jgi:bifunctional DNA-binding transcriptional regulator/antitoxin component of YhaV-PrlF toxin-antitoxin module
MVVAKRTIKNQLTLPKAVVEQAGMADYYDVVCDNGRIVLTPLHPGGAAAARMRLVELGISETDVADAVSWARRP